MQRWDERDIAGGALWLFTFGGKWIEYKILPGSDGGGQLNFVTENLKALPFFISLHELLSVVIKNPVFMPVSLHFRSLTFIWIFVPVWGCWVLFPPHLTNEEREVCDIKWFVQVTQKASDGVSERVNCYFSFSTPVTRGNPTKCPGYSDIQPYFLPGPEAMVIPTWTHVWPPPCPSLTGRDFFPVRPTHYQHIRITINIHCVQSP